MKTRKTVIDGPSVNGEANPLTEGLVQLNITTDVEYVTKDDAVELLGRNWEGQRDVRYRRAAQYAADMRNGLWQPGVAVVDVDVNGNVINGQHVLAAIRESGLTQLVTMRRGMPTSAFKAIDQHGARSLKDVLKSSGVARPQDVSGFLGRMCTFASIGRWQEGGSTLSAGARMRLWDEMSRWQTKAGHHVAPFDLIGEAGEVNNKFQLSTGFVLSLYYTLAISDPENDGGVALVQAFNAKLVRGVDLVEGSPVLAYREYLIDRMGKRTTRTGLDRKDALSAVAAKTFRAWDAWLSGATITRLIGTRGNGQFPLPNDKHGNLAAWRKKMAPIVEVSMGGGFVTMAKTKKPS